MRFSVFITTRNRCADLRRTCQRLMSMRPPPDEVLVCADGCSDDTESMVTKEFPSFVLLVNERSFGSVASRDRLIRAATGDILVSLDDDSYPVHDGFFARLPSIFDSHAEAAVICFPELRDGGVFADATKTDQAIGHYASSYANCAAAMRRDVYLAQPGFPHLFGHMYEEPDYSLQCYSAGLAVWFEPSLVIRHHLSSAGRAPIVRHHQNARNELWSVWMRCPWPWLIGVSLFRVFRQLQHALTQGPAWVVREPVWWLAALAGAPECVRARRPVPWPTYYAWMRLARQRIPVLQDLSPALLTRQ